MSHEFLNLISSVSLNAGAIIEEADGHPSGRHIAGRAGAIRRATSRMAHIVNSLLDVTSLEAGMLDVRRVACDAALVVREALELLAPAADQRGLRLEASVPSEPLRAMMDAARVLQVLTNLLMNAVKFTSSPGVVSLRVRHVAGAIEFVVSDTGYGIPADKLAGIFERYSRASPERAAGHGLGLYIARQLIEAHGGTISVESQPGHGTTFTFTVPAAD